MKKRPRFRITVKFTKHVTDIGFGEYRVYTRDESDDLIYLFSLTKEMTECFPTLPQMCDYKSEVEYVCKFERAIKRKEKT